MPAFNQTQVQQKARNANTVLLLIGDQPIAFAQSVSHSFDLGTEGIYGVGNAKPQEIQQLKMAPEITLTNIDLTTLGMQSVQANQTTLASLLANNEFNIHVVDGNTGQALFTYTGSVATNFNQNIQSNTPITDEVRFLGKDCLDITGQSLLNGPSALNI